MAEVIMNGRVYTIFEASDTSLISEVGLLRKEMRNREKNQREIGWKQKAILGYRKK